ncbi:cupin domain-containing protein [Rhabdochromatium marinum]|uniref:cupin domain-containing protein n=1 Tax=Rhabdochromatium marinum TaxID=48729 RepID=UPI001907B70E|nr:cupin domain-containing protein [Rhabdochromatium marinum]MBK1648330.1 cupin [Rhabdochromatium marinum]
MHRVQTGDWEIFHLADIEQLIPDDVLSMREFLRTPSLSCSLYHVPAGSKDMASAHEEDEVYLILKGRGRLRVEEDEQPVKPGTLMYVRASCDHAFFEVEESITALAFFGTATHRRERNSVS